MLKKNLKFFLGFTVLLLTLGNAQARYPNGCNGYVYKKVVRGWLYKCYEGCYCHGGGDRYMGKMRERRCLKLAARRGAMGANTGNGKCHLKYSCPSFRPHEDRGPYCHKVRRVRRDRDYHTNHDDFFDLDSFLD